MADTTADDRQKRIEELKRKMQESAKNRQTADSEPEAESESTEPTSASTTEAASSVSIDEEETADSEGMSEEASAGGEADAVTETDEAPSAEISETTVAMTETAEEVQADVVEEASESDAEEIKAQAEMSRRELLTYSWGAALGLLTVETLAASYLFMYPRFRAGEFGGKFFLQESELPSNDAAPVAESDGKFWLINTDEGPKALYMVCTHLGCLYKWEPANWRFECPCHGSKFDKEGFYIEGPAPRSLDSFDIVEEEPGVISVNTGRKIAGSSAADSPARKLTA
ncbi:Rieske 2Fe-2S domain-containing protein [Chloroflexi bacterium TSY]|nr:Rieske 2Fe-2S domain-containing protein [Chloroflexi bacterium TSY]